MPFLRVAVFLLTIQLAHAQQWPMFGRDNAHTSFVPAAEAGIHRANIGDLRLAWETKFDAPFSAAATVTDGVIYVGAWNGMFHALDATTGAIRWSQFVGIAPSPE